MSRPPLDRASLALVQAQLTRRTLMAGAGGVGLAAVLAACGSEPQKKTSSERSAKDLSSTEKEVTFSNWPLYIDYNDAETKRPSLEAFEKQTGISVKYTEDINDNNEFFGKIQPQLSAGQPTGRDLFALTDWMAARLIRLGWVQKLDKSNIPNADNVVPALATPPWDPKRDFSLPWQSGFAFIAYNEKITKPVRNMDELLTRPDLKGKVTLLSEMRDTMGLQLLQMGVDPSKDFSNDQFMAAIDKIQQAVDYGQVRKFTGNEYAQDLAKGNIAACVAWSGDVIQLQFDDPAIKYTIPEAGATLWADNMQIPNKASHKTNAEKLMNYYYDPEVAAEVAAWVNYICPVEGAQAAMEKIDPDLATNQLIFPNEETLSNAFVFRGLSEKEESTYDDAFQTLIGA
ncbi:MAG: polyamine ABC transporter substrate-binding protein [Actinomycetes bacterium]